MTDTGVAYGGSARAEPEAGYGAYIRASQARYPRGGVWVFAAWYAVMAGVLIVETNPGAGLRAFYLAAFAFSAAAMVLLLRANGVLQFRADQHGLRFGAAASVREVTWSDVAQLRIIPGRRGARLDIILSPAAMVTYRSPARQAADLAFMFLVPGAGVRRNFPATMVPRRNPARYELQLLKVTPAELRDRLATLAPGIPVEVAG